MEYQISKLRDISCAGTSAKGSTENPVRGLCADNAEYADKVSLAGKKVAAGSWLECAAHIRRKRRDLQPRQQAYQGRTGLLPALPVQAADDRHEYTQQHCRVFSPAGVDVQ